MFENKLILCDLNFYEKPHSNYTVIDTCDLNNCIKLLIPDRNAPDESSYYAAHINSGKFSFFHRGTRINYLYDVSELVNGNIKLSDTVAFNGYVFTTYYYDKDRFLNLETFEGGGCTSLYNLRTKQTVEYNLLPKRIANIKPGTTDRFMEYRGDTGKAPKENRYILASHISNIISFFTISVDTMTLTHRYTNYNFQNLTNNNYTPIQKELINEAVCVTDNHAYVLHRDYTEDGLKNSVILKFTWGGVLVKRYTVDNDIITFTVDNNETKMYGIKFNSNYGNQIVVAPL